MQDDQDQDPNLHVPPPMHNYSRSRNNTIDSSTNASSSMYHSMHDIHSLDWSNTKGSVSEYGGGENTSVGDSTLTSKSQSHLEHGVNISTSGHGDGHGWDGRVNRVPNEGRSPNSNLNNSKISSRTNFMTPSSEFTKYGHGRGSGHGNEHGIPKPMDVSPRSHSNASSPSSRGSSKQLINDIVWLEKKIADVRKRVDKLDGEEESSNMSDFSPPVSPFSVNKSIGGGGAGAGGGVGSPITTDIVCRDVVAPPGKLQIVIHSTKDGPAIHSVKSGSVLEGKLFSGDLILSVNDTDCRKMKAEDVMQMMASSNMRDRKLTVLHAAY